MEPWLSYTEENQQVNYNKPHDYSKDCFTIEALESGTIQWNISGNTIDYSLNDGDWAEMDSGTTLTASSGDIFKFRGDNNSYGGSYTSATINATFSFNTYGNIMSLISSTGFETLTTIPTAACFSGFFRGCKVVDASNLILPATTLAIGCYSSMFSSCTSLISVPELPATTLAIGCYQGMFGGCTSLVAAPELPATTLANYCYQYMFNGCTSITAAPELPATTLANDCYSGMFVGCTSLTTAPELPATTLANACYEQMFSNCTSLTTAPELPATTLVGNCYCGMFYGCRALTTAPELPATTLAANCYGGLLTNNPNYVGMFEECVSLTKAPSTLPATTLFPNCYYSMFKGCTSLETAPEIPNCVLRQDSCKKMFYDCSKLNYVKAMFTEITMPFDPTFVPLSQWLSGVSETGTFVKNSAATWNNSSAGIPDGWTVETATA